MGPSVDGNLVAAVDKSLKTKDLWPARDAILMGILDIVEEVDDADKLRPYANRVAVRLLTHFMCIRLLSFFSFRASSSYFVSPKSDVFNASSTAAMFACGTR